VEIVVATDARSAAEEAARRVATRLRDAVRRRGVATVAFSGGSTPALMLESLALLTVPWRDVRVFQVDERVAPDGDPARNAALLDVLPVRPGQLALLPVTARDLPRALRRYAARLPERFDLVHLGIGDDGHTASWPPGDPVIDAADPIALCGEFNGFVRATLTPVAVNAARARLVLATGAPKAAVVARWLLHDAALPVERVRRTGTVVVLDAAAAALLLGEPG
jgi:6-phosphogluconolactonase/glucosamine-6-phosphate isomerase/deaminase